MGGGFKSYCHFYPEPWGNVPIWRAYVSKGWFNRQPEHVCHHWYVSCRWKGRIFERSWTIPNLDLDIQKPGEEVWLDRKNIPKTPFTSGGIWMSKALQVYKIRFCGINLTIFDVQILLFFQKHRETSINFAEQLQRNKNDIKNSSKNTFNKFCRELQINNTNKKERDKHIKKCCGKMEINKNCLVYWEGFFGGPFTSTKPFGMTGGMHSKTIR